MSQTTIRVWTPAGFAENDPWETLADGAPVTSRSIVPLGAFHALDDAAKGRVRALRIDPADKVEMIGPWLSRFELVAVSFPAFNDGRAFSHATLLRERLGYGGEIRAVGDVLIDQVAFMLRCGIDSIAVANPVAIARLQQGQLGEVANYYQPTARASAPEGGYSWRRKATTG